MRSAHVIMNAMAAVGLSASLVLGGCSDDPTGNDQATVTMQAEMGQAFVAKAVVAESAAADNVDSLRVNRVRLLVTRLKLHRDKEDSVSGDRTVKTEPFVITFQPSQPVQFATAAVPAGTYDKVKFEFHKIGQNNTDTTLNDFISGNERYSAIFDVTLFKDGDSTQHTYKSDMTANLSIKLDPAVTLNAGSATTLALNVDPMSVFKKGGKVLDPRDSSNESEIDNALKDAIKALKK